MKAIGIRPCLLANCPNLTYELRWSPRWEFTKPQYLMVSELEAKHPHSRKAPRPVRKNSR